MGLREPNWCTRVDLHKQVLLSPKLRRLSWEDSLSLDTNKRVLSPDQVHSCGLDITSRAGIWAVAHFHLWLLLIRDEAGFVAAFSLVLGPKSWGDACTSWTKSSAGISAAASWQPEVGEDGFLRRLLPSNGGPWEGSKCYKLGWPLGYWGTEASIFTAPSLSLEGTRMRVQLHG